MLALLTHQNLLMSSFDVYCARGIKIFQCLVHTGRVSSAIPAIERSGLPLADEGCAPLLREPITASQAVGFARILKALADPIRLQLVSIVAAHENSEACVCELTGHLGLSQPKISYHLKLLTDAGIFTRDKRGVWSYYTLQPAAFNAIAAVLAPADPAGCLPRRARACAAQGHARRGARAGTGRARTGGARTGRGRGARG
jgi:ArsR family transcriptional regulator